MDERNPTRKDLNEALDAFLKERRSSSRGGGWAEVSLDDMQQLSQLIAMLVRLKSEEDADGDLTVEWHLTDRTRYEGQHFIQVPYIHGHKNRTTKDREAALKSFNRHYTAVLLNLNIAMGAFQQADRMRGALEIGFAFEAPVKPKE